MAADHRAAIGEAIRGDLLLRTYRRSEAGGLVQYAGLWGAWWGGGDPTDVPDGLKVVFATVNPSLVPTQAPETTTLTDCPWVVLQLQALDANDPPWAAVLEALHVDIDARAAADNATSAAPCPGRITYDNKQRNHDWWDVSQPNVLSSYRMCRLERGSAEAHVAQPAVGVNRERIEYQVSQDGNPVPLRVWMEHRLPKHQQVAQRLSAESGLVREGDLLSAVKSWSTWILAG